MCEGLNDLTINSLVFWVGLLELFITQIDELNGNEPENRAKNTRSDWKCTNLDEAQEDHALRRY
jgi:hypothetical protein